MWSHLEVLCSISAQITKGPWVRRTSPCRVDKHTNDSPAKEYLTACTCKLGMWCVTRGFEKCKLKFN